MTFILFDGLLQPCSLVSVTPLKISQLNINGSNQCSLCMAKVVCRIPPLLLLEPKMFQGGTFAQNAFFDSNEYPCFMFSSKNKKIMYTPVHRSSTI